MKDLRERCEKLYVDLYSYKHPPQDEGMIREFESFALEIRNEALEEACMEVDKLDFDDETGLLDQASFNIRALKSTERTQGDGG